MKTLVLAILAVAAATLILGTVGANAACLKKGAVATSADEKSAKWFAMETMVQAVDWGLWPGYVATSKVEGYKVMGERYRCKKGDGGVTCEATASFCK